MMWVAVDAGTNQPVPAPTFFAHPRRPEVYHLPPMRLGGGLLPVQRALQAVVDPDPARQTAQFLLGEMC